MMHDKELARWLDEHPEEHRQFTSVLPVAIFGGAVTWALIGIFIWSLK